MGQVTTRHESLIHFRSWKAQQVADVLQQVRRNSPVLYLTKERFLSFFGERARDTACVFNDLDSDFDGRVDVFEALVTMVLWSRSSWPEKLDLLFQCFDFNAKQTLRPDELLFMGVTIAQSLGKFARLDEKWDKEAMRAAVHTAFDATSTPAEQRLAEVTGGSSLKTTLHLDQFKAWFQENEVTLELQQFVNEHCDIQRPEAVESSFQKAIRLLEYRLDEQVAILEKLRAARDQAHGEDVDRPPAQQTRYDFVLQSLDKLLVKLARSSETQRHELGQLTQEDQGHAQPILEPRRRLKHGQILMELDVLQQAFVLERKEAEELLSKLHELTYQPGTAAKHVPLPALQDMRHDIEEQSDLARSERLLNREYKKMLMKKTVGDEPELVGLERGEEQFPTVVAFADFDPPPSHAAAMLSLRVGEEIVATGQDGHGWWYGRNASGKEGWFPPSYTSLKER